MIHVSLVEDVIHVEKYMTYTNHMIDLECGSCIFVEEVFHVHLVEKYTYPMTNHVKFIVLSQDVRPKFPMMEMYCSFSGCVA